MVLEGAEIRCVIYCDKVKTTMRSLNLSAGARNCCCCCGVKKLTIFDPSHFNVKRGCGEIPRDLTKKCDIDVTAAWQQSVPTASEHYWSIVCFSWSGSFCRQPMILLWPGVRTLTLTSDNVRNWETARREKDCCRVFENLDQEIDDDKGFFYWEVTPNIKDDADDQLWLKDWPPLIFSRCFNKWLVPGGGEISPPT